MNLTKTMIRGWCGSTNYNRGKGYFESGLVRRFSVQFQGEEALSAHCLVEGTRTYDVSLRITGSNLMAQCTCPRYADTGSCKHLAAALLYLERQLKDAKEDYGTDKSASLLLEQYRRKVARTPVSYSGQARLVPSLETGEMGDYPDLVFQVGYDRLYVVKDVGEFLERVEQRESASYGKYLTLNHGLPEFTPWSQRLIELLMEQYRIVRNEDGNSHYSYRYSSYYYGHYRTLNRYNRRSISLEGEAFDRFFP